LDVCLVLHADHTFNASTLPPRGGLDPRIYTPRSWPGSAPLEGFTAGPTPRFCRCSWKSSRRRTSPGGWKRLAQGQKIGHGPRGLSTMDPRASFLRDGLAQKKLGQEKWPGTNDLEKAAVEALRRRGSRPLNPMDFQAPVYHHGHSRRPDDPVSWPA
jgi:citrate synthase